jgi:hypothetical protein
MPIRLANILIIHDSMYTYCFSFALYLCHVSLLMRKTNKLGFYEMSFYVLIIYSNEYKLYLSFVDDEWKNVFSL